MNKRIVFIKIVCEMTGLHRQTIWRYIKANKFPKPSKIENRNAWYLHEIEQWQDEQMGKVQ